MEENKSAVSRLRKVIIETPTGKKVINMQPVIIDTSENAPGINDTICSSCCPYGSICDKLRDPRNPDDPDGRLEDWCLENDFKEDNIEVSEFATMVPMEGSIENLYPEESEPFKQLMELNPSINLRTLIDSVCPGFCDQYKKDHSSCSLNSICIFKSLFTRPIAAKILNKREDNETTNTSSN